MGKKNHILKIESLSFAYQEEKALVNLSLKLDQGERLGIVGASGSGKSTLLKLMAAKLVADQGSIIFQGENLAESRNDRVPGHDKIALMSQDFDLIPDLTLEDNIARRGRHLSPTALKRYLGKVKRAFHLQSIKKRKVKHLSGGQKQRTALAAALISSAELILLDEPFSQLDYQLKQDMLEFLRQEQGAKTIVMVGHEPTDLMRFCDRIAVLEKGRLIAQDTIHNIFHYPKNEKVAQITGLYNLIPPQILEELAWEEKLVRPSHLYLKRKGPWILERIEYHAFGRLALLVFEGSQYRVWAQLASDRDYQLDTDWTLEIKKPRLTI